MSEVRISLLGAAGALDNTEVLPINQGGVTKRTTLAAVRGGVGRSTVDVATVVVTPADHNGCIRIFPPAGGTVVSFNKNTFPGLSFDGARYRIVCEGLSGRPVTFQFLTPTSDVVLYPAGFSGALLLAGDAVDVMWVDGKWVMLSLGATVSLRAGVTYGDGGTVGIGSGVLPIYASSANYSSKVRVSSATLVTAQIFSLLTQPYVSGTEIHLLQVGDGQVDIVAAAAAVPAVINVPAGRIARTRAKGSRVELHLYHAIDGGRWDLTGDLATV